MREENSEWAVARSVIRRMKPPKSKATSPVADRQLITFLDLAKKCNRKKSPPGLPPFGLPQSTTNKRGCATRLNLRLLAADRGGAQGKGDAFLCCYT
jgi:hypothetical protein